MPITLVQLDHTVYILGQEKECMVKLTSLPDGVPQGKCQENCCRRRAVFDRISQVKS